eukprot:484219-Rhodomonas_salina.2
MAFDFAAGVTRSRRRASALYYAGTRRSLSATNLLRNVRHHGSHRQCGNWRKQGCYVMRCTGSCISYAAVRTEIGYAATRRQTIWAKILDMAEAR